MGYSHGPWAIWPSIGAIAQHMLVFVWMAAFSFRFVFGGDRATSKSNRTTRQPYS
jgi:hypothetical protein